MKWIDEIKNHIPMEQMQILFTQVKARIASQRIKKVDPHSIEAEKVMKRIHFLLSEKSNLDLGKQEIYTRNGCTYVVDFNDPEQIKRLRTVLLELADLSSPDSSKAKKRSIPGYLDYIAQASI